MDGAVARVTGGAAGRRGAFDLDALRREIAEKASRSFRVVDISG